VRGENDVRVVVQRVPTGRLGVEYVESDPGQLAAGEGAPDGIGVDEGAAAAVDQHRTRLDPGEKGVVDQVVGLSGQREVQADDITAPGEVIEAGAAHVGRRLADRVIGQDPHPERRPQRRGPLADAAVADHAQGGVPQVPDRDVGALGPAALAHQRGERAESLDQVQRHADRTLGHRRGTGARRDHHGDAPAGGGGHVDQFDAHSGAGDDRERGGLVEQGLVDPGVRADDGARGNPQVGRAGIGDEPAVPVEHPGHQRGVDRAESHHDRQMSGHWACPKVAPDTGVTLCQAPSRAEAAVAEMTSASASASSMVELRCSPPLTATRNFSASMTLRSS